MVFRFQKKVLFLLIGVFSVNGDSQEAKKFLRLLQEDPTANDEERELKLTDQEERELQRDIQLERQFPGCIDASVCDPVQDPITSPKFRNANIPALSTEDPFCVNFGTPGDLEGFAPCPNYFDNIEVNVYGSPSPDDEINPLRGDTYLHLRDRSRASLACGTGSGYTGDYTGIVAEKCWSLCFDINLFFDGCKSGVANCVFNATTGGWYLPGIFPTLILQGGAPNYYRAAFRAHEQMTDPDGNSTGWRRICAPLGPLDFNGDLPGNDDGQWYMGAPNDILSGLPPVTGQPPSPNSAWPDLLADVAAIQVPVDYTANPAERVGFDHLCLEEGECIDVCTPEPLCYWKHEWNCESVKRESWYGNLTDLVDTCVKTFNSKNLWVCDVLEECCPDLCDFAEQEFLALLLNVASGFVSLECGVKECGDCLHSVKDIITIVDDLLAHSSRSDHDCSKALQYLTGVNQDVELCDSQGDCPQSEKCRANNGRCVDKELCDSTDPDVACLDDLCPEGHDCTCLIVQTALDCKQTDVCTNRGGRCVSKTFCDPSIPGTSCIDDLCQIANDPINQDCTCIIEVDVTPMPTPAPVMQDCVDTENCLLKRGTCVDVNDCINIPGSVVCDPDICDGNNCVCKIGSPACEQSSQCALAHGTCVKVADCVGTCRPELCDGAEDCTCQIDDVVIQECKTSQACQFHGTGGVCTRDCVPIPGFVQCAEDLCEERGCECKNCLQKDEKCIARGGKCLLIEDCLDQAGSNDDLQCDRTLCGGADPDIRTCGCLLPNPACEITDECLLASGICVTDCQESFFFACGDECNPIATGEECRCLKCRNSQECKARKGLCTPNCISGGGFICDPDLCPNDSTSEVNCSCRYPVIEG